MSSACPSCGAPAAPGLEGAPCARCLASLAERPTGPPPAEEAPLSPGARFHGLEILGLIARGGMGIVYKARQPSLDRPVALKILPPSLATQAEFRDRFDREARALAGLSHPSIVAIHDCGIEDALPFLVMEFVDGRSLRHALRSGRLPTDEALRIAREVAEALDAAHALGVIHRDIKPDNVLLDAAGRVKITDFGLAKLVGLDGTRLTQSDIVVGTPHYMAPEQLQRPLDVDRRADVYSFGVLLYEMLTGALPIGRFPPPSEKGAGHPLIDAVVLKCLETDPAKRYPDAGALKAALHLATGAAPAVPPPQPRLRQARNTPLCCGACGWAFFVPGSERGLVNCPKCRAPVATHGSGRPAAPASSPRHVPARRRLPPVLLGIGACLAAGLLIAVVAVVRATAVPARPSSPPVGNPAPPPVAERLPLPSATSPPPVPVPAAPREHAIIDYEARIDRAARLCNLAGLVGTILFHEGRVEELRQLDERLDAFEEELRLVERRRTESRRPGRPVPPHLRRGERLVGLDALRLEPASPQDFAEGLRGWLRTFKAGVRPTYHLARDGAATAFPAEFPERTKELSALAHLVDIILGEGNRADAPAVQPPPAAAEPLPLPADLVLDLDRRVSALAPYHQARVLDGDLQRARRLLKEGRGLPEDVDFLRLRIQADLLPAVEAEWRDFAVQAADLEPRALRGSGAPPDVVVFKDGRRLEGAVEEAKDGRLRIKGRLGSITVNPEEVLRIEKGRGTGGEFAARWEAAKGKRPDLEALLRWCAERGLKEARQLTAYALLQIDPGHEPARQAAGHVRDAAGVWTRGEPTAGANGTIEWHGRAYTPDELARELQSLGYANLNGLWYAKVPAVYKIDNLYRDGGRLALRGGTIAHQLQNSQDMVYDVQRLAWVPRARAVETMRYLSGGVLLEIAAPGEIVECRIRARGLVAQIGGSVEASVVLSPDDRSPRALFQLTAPGENWQSIDVSDKVRGATRFYLRASVGGTGLFLPSDANDLGVLEVRYSFGEPLRRINELLRLRVPPPAPDAAAIEAVVRRAAEVYAENRILTEVLRDMRSSAERHAYPKDVEIPPRFQALAALIEDPLRPKLESRPREQLVQVGEWWGAMAVEDRRTFAYVYGLWCARWKALGR